MTLRRLVVCFDGTWNTPDSGAEPTNVVKLLRAVRARDDSGVTQVAFYDKGVGTAGFCDSISGALGNGLTENVIDGYRFLGNNYLPGDEIYIFGFSRGAYTARSLAGFIKLVGMVSPNHMGRKLLAALDVYRNKDLDHTAKAEAIQALKLERYEDVPIRCVGVWDTVGSLGIPGDLGRRRLGDRFYFHDVQLSPGVDVALHAVAIDEKRSQFAPTLWVSPDGRPSKSGQIVEQVWFPGVHSNVGGSYKDAGLSDIALDWMVKRVQKHTHLAFDPDYLTQNCAPNANGAGYESRSALYLTSKVYPYQRLIGQTVPQEGGVGEWVRTTIKSFDRRNIIPDGLQTINETVHISALERWRCAVVPHDCPEDSNCKPQPYRPVNLKAVIEAHHAGHGDVPVVGWDGEKMPWPAL